MNSNPRNQAALKYSKSERGREVREAYRASGKAQEAQKKFQRTQPLKYMLNRIRGSAKRRGLEFSLLETDFQTLPKYCPVLNIELKYPGEALNADDPAIASIDRIDNSMGYIAGNVAIISLRANKLKRDASLEELQALTKWLESFK